MLRRRNESELHYRIKRATWSWLWDRGCRAIAFEASPDFAAGARVDVLAWAPDRTTYIVEAKQSRGDFLRDLARDASGGYLRAVREMRHLWERYERVVEGARHLALARELPSHLAVPEFAPYAEAHLQLALRLRRRLARAQPPKAGKFALPALAEVVRFRYLAAPSGVIAPEELPDGWGLLRFEDPRVVLARPARPTGRGDHARVLQEVARVNTQDLMLASGVHFRAGKPVVPRDLPPFEVWRPGRGPRK